MDRGVDRVPVIDECFSCQVSRMIVLPCCSVKCLGHSNTSCCSPLLRVDAAEPTASTALSLNCLSGLSTARFDRPHYSICTSARRWPGTGSEGMWGIRNNQPFVSLLVAHRRFMLRICPIFVAYKLSRDENWKLANRYDGIDLPDDSCRILVWAEQTTFYLSIRRSPRLALKHRGAWPNTFR